MSEPYTRDWYADLMDRTEVRYSESDMDRLRARIKALEQEVEALKTRLADMIRHNFRP